mmetsp:Transcript_122771/g.319253  ORF Transcript_122771/g.319253 Transcript_122771/m.319253 type:complete len:90 (-) Transcript_122771:138-407(-)
MDGVMGQGSSCSGHYSVLDASSAHRILRAGLAVSVTNSEAHVALGTVVTVARGQYCMCWCASLVVLQAIFATGTTHAAFTAESTDEEQH